MGRTRTQGRGKMDFKYFEDRQFVASIFLSQLTCVILIKKLSIFGSRSAHIAARCPRRRPRPKSRRWTTSRLSCSGIHGQCNRNIARKADTGAISSTPCSSRNTLPSPLCTFLQLSRIGTRSPQQLACRYMLRVHKRSPRPSRVSRMSHGAVVYEGTASLS